MRKILRALILAIFLACMLQPAMAINIGATPGSMRFERMAQEGYAERDLLVTTNSNENLSGHIDFGGEMGQWIRLESNDSRFFVSRSAPFRNKIVIEPPRDARPGNYSGTVSFVTDTVQSVSGTTGSAVKASVAIVISVEVVGDEFVSCTVGGFGLSDAEAGKPLDFSAAILNGGNVRIQPAIEFTFWDQLQRTILLTDKTTAPLIYPTRRETLLRRIEQNLPLGQYWMEVSIPDCKASQLLTFSVVEPGAIADSGTIDGIFVKPYGYVGEPAEITSVFTNNGPRSVVSQFKGQVYKDNVLIGVLESDELVVSPHQQSNFKMFYTPSADGVYSVTGRFVYNGKLSFEKTATFSAIPKEEGGSFSPLSIIIYFAILIVIIALIILIRREMRRSRHE